MNNMSSLSASSGTLVFLSSTVKNSQRHQSGHFDPRSQRARLPHLRDHGKKPAPYQIPEYMADWERVRYKDNACDNAAIPMPPQEAFLTYQTDASVQNSGTPTSTPLKPSTLPEMLETNTASCGGFAGAPDSYAAGLYLIDLPPQGASIGMSQILLHNGGVGQTYNLFTPPPNNISTFRQWTTTPPYYSALIMGGVMEEEGSQVMDLPLSGNSTPPPAAQSTGMANPSSSRCSTTSPTPAVPTTLSVNFPSSQPAVSV
ncbi:hypothetical protein FRC00_001394, partial [Tulasnella sp. 408]